MKKILVVDNHPVILKFMSNLLGKEGHQVKTAEDGLSALDILMTYIPDVMFIDLVMPNINGEQLCRMIRKMPALKDTYAVILSATMAEESRDFSELGADAFIVKGPFNQMAKHVLAAIEQSDHDIPKAAAEEIMGSKGVYKREITKELISAKGHLEAILRNISDAIIELAPEGRIIFANSAAVSLMGLSEEELLGSKFTELINEGDRKGIEDFLTRIDEGSEKVDLDTPVLINSRQISLSMLPVKAGVSSSCMLVLNDITEAMRAEAILKKAREELERRVKERTIELAKTNKQLQEEIHNRTRAEKVLKASEERYRSLFEQSRDAIVITTRRGELIDANTYALNLFGYTKKEMQTMTFQELYVNPDDGYRFRKEMKERGTVRRFETQLRRSNGVEMDCLFNVVHRQNEKGTILGYQGIIRDITETKLALEEMKTSQQRLSQIINFLPDATMVIDLEGKVIAWNRAIENMTGIKSQEMLGKGDYEYAIPFYGERRPVLIDLVGQWNKEIEEKYQYVKKEGESLVSETYDPLVKPGGFLWNKASLLYDYNGEVIGAIESIRDITDRKVAEEALQESEERYRTLVDNLPVAVYRNTPGPEGQFLMANPAFCKMFGFNNEEEVKKVAPADIYANPEERQQYSDNLIEKVVVENDERTLVKRDGTPVYTSITSRVVYGKGGEVSHFDSIMLDITTQKKLTNQLQQAQKMEAIATLAGGVAHEFNNALMGIMGNIELLRMELPEDERRDRYFGAMKDSGYRMSRLTDQLLAYAQGGKYQPKNLKLDEFVIQTLPILKHDLSPQVRVETHFPKDISYIRADQAQMQMVLSAILSNSNEAMEDEGLIRITAGNKDLDENFTKQHPGLKPGSYVCLMIEDDGKGMDKETKGGIFEPFFTTKFQGRGMGMAAVYGIMKNHGGWIYVDSELGKGTTVRIYLPAISAESKEQGAKPVKQPEIELNTGEGTILMIEDEDVVIEVTQAMLEMLGYRVMVAKTGKDAIHITETFDGQIDLALLDIKLPDMEGRKVYPLIMEARPDLKVIVFSGYSIEGPAQDILDAGAQDFIQKPFSLATLSEKLKEFLEGKTNGRNSQN